MIRTTILPSVLLLLVLVLVLLLIMSNKSTSKQEPSKKDEETIPFPTGRSKFMRLEYVTALHFRSGIQKINRGGNRNILPILDLNFDPNSKNARYVQCGRPSPGEVKAYLKKVRARRPSLNINRDIPMIPIHCPPDDDSDEDKNDSNEDDDDSNEDDDVMIPFSLTQRKEEMNHDDHKVDQSCPGDEIKAADDNEGHGDDNVVDLSEPVNMNKAHGDDKDQQDGANVEHVSVSPFSSWLLNKPSPDDVSRATLAVQKPRTLEDADTIVKEIIAGGFRNEVTRKSMHTLTKGEWLGDEIINFFTLLLLKHDKKMCRKSVTSRKRSFIFKSFFITTVLQTGHASVDGQYDYTRVSNWSKKVPGKLRSRRSTLCIV